jgi:hypothetical protein
VFDVRIYAEEHSIAKLQSRLETAKPTAVKISARDLEKNAGAQANQTRKVLMLNQTSRRTTLNWEDEQKGQGGGKGPGGQGGAGRPDLSKSNLLYKLDVDYNLAAFNSAIANIDKERVRQKRKVYNFLYTEAIMSMENIPGTEPRKRRSRFFPWRSLGRQAGTSATAAGASGARAGLEAGDYEMGGLGEDDTPEEGLKGISFQKMLMILAHYKLIEDDQCLSIRDMFHHRQKMDRIHAHMSVIKIRSVLLKFLIRQRFLKHYRAVQRIQALTGASWSDDQPPIGGDPSSGPPPPPPSDVSGPSSSSSSTPLTARSAPMGASSTPAGAGVGGPSQHSASSMAQSSGVAAAHSTVSSTSSGSPRKQVRINVDNDIQDTPSSSTVAFTDSNIVGPGSSYSLKSVIEEDPIEPVQAGAMIDDLRSEWRSKSFLSFFFSILLNLFHDFVPVCLTSQLNPSIYTFRIFFSLLFLAFISNHDMSVTGTTDAGQAAALQSATGVFQIMDVNTPRPSPRREVLGLDYL